MFRDVRNGCEVEFDPEVIDWMKNHTIADLEEIAERLELEGSDSSEMRRCIIDLRDMAGERAFA